MPKVSVVMASYNASKTIANALMSIVNQTYKDWELILVEDGSKDRKELEAKLMLFEDDRIKYIPIEHSGVVKAYMTGVDAAKGSLIALQGADDLSLPNRLEQAVKEIGDCDVYMHGLYTNIWSEKLMCVMRGYRKGYTGEGIRCIEREMLRHQCLNGVPIVKRSKFKLKPLREEAEHAVDWMMHLDWLFSGFKYKINNEALYEYVRYSDSLSHRNEKEGKRHKALEKIQKIMKDEYKVDFNPNDFKKV